MERSFLPGPCLMLSDYINPSIIMQFLQMSSLRKALNIIAHMQTLHTLLFHCVTSPVQVMDSVQGPMYFTTTLSSNNALPVSQKVIKSPSFFTSPELMVQGPYSFFQDRAVTVSCKKLEMTTL